MLSYWESGELVGAEAAGDWEVGPRVKRHSTADLAPARRPGAFPREKEADDSSNSCFLTTADLQVGSKSRDSDSEFPS